MIPYTLPNGIKCILESNKCHQSVTINIMFRVGSRDEPSEYYGLTHFAEHMFFKGTKNRPQASLISGAIDQFGGLINAVTSYDVTYYYIKIDADQLELALDVLSDMLFNSLFSSKDIKSEKEVVVEEIQMYQSNPSRHVNTILEELIYQGSTLEHNIGGDIDIIRGATRSKFLAFLSHFYQPSNTIISIVGNFDNGVTKKLLLKYFDKNFNYLPEKKLIKFKPRILFKNFYQRQNQMRYKSQAFPNMKNTYLMIGFPSFGYHSKQYYASMVISAILSGGMSSRLFIEVRERRGLVYTIISDIDSYQDLGNFTIKAATSGSEKKINQVIILIIKELKKIVDGKFNASEIKKAKDYLIGGEKLRRESSSYLAQRNGYDLICFNRLIKPEFFMNQIKKVNKKDIMEVASKLFQWQKLNLSVISNKKLEKNKITKGCDSIL